MMLLHLLLLSTISATEVIQNGGFESGLDHWTKRGCEMSSETWDAHQGERSCHVSRRQETWSGPEQTLDLALLRNQPSAVLSYAVKVVQVVVGSFQEFRDIGQK